jgi:hypothetical protein
MSKAAKNAYQKASQGPHMASETSSRRRRRNLWIETAYPRREGEKGSERVG